VAGFEVELRIKPSHLRYQSKHLIDENGCAEADRYLTAEMWKYAYSQSLHTHKFCLRMKCAYSQILLTHKVC